jgi:hypothetical protein
MREGQVKVRGVIDSYTALLTSAKESNAFVEELRQRVGMVEYETPPASAEAVQVDRELTGAEALGIFKQAMPVSFKGYTFQGNELRKGLRSWPLNECEANVETGAAVSSRVTATRVVAGAMMFGNTGALVGAISKKDRSKVYLTISVADNVFLEEVRGLDEGKARQFANKLNQAAASSRKHPVGQPIPTVAAPPPPPPSAVPAGWYPQGEVQRYWDGSEWTEHTAPLPPS